MAIWKTVDDLLKVVAGLVFRDFTSIRDDFEQFSPLYMLHDNQNISGGVQYLK